MKKRSETLGSDQSRYESKGKNNYKRILIKSALK